MLRTWIATILAVASLTSVNADGPAFVRHDLNPESTFCACAAVDVNRDGQLDVVCGGWWYEAPAWERRFLRNVEEIRGRYDDYSNLPLDVDGDGWTDLISANYRSRSVYWVRNPGSKGGDWAKRIIDTPGAMETGRLADVDGDGQMDILPNGTKFAVWYRLQRQAAPDGNSVPQWVRHDLPEEIAGHGIGIGDINGDGRNDIVSSRGWLEAPPHPREERWQFHDDLRLDGDGSIPVLVYDVDQDGDNDVVWGRGHRIGLYWMERMGHEAGRPVWQRHAIDTSWSQAHSILLGDVDGDGVEELVAGKRYMGHDGKDPGEYDPLVAYWYDFDVDQRVWHRNVISLGGPAGFGLDPKTVDLDADGDVDLLVSGRSGLFWFENLLVNKRATPLPTQVRAVADYDDHSQVLTYQDESKRIRPVSTPAEMAIRRGHILAGMEKAMGSLPDPSRRVPLDIQVTGEEEVAAYVRQSITYVPEPGDRVPAFLLIPKNLQGRLPAMLCLHQTTSIGKAEPAGLGGRPTLHYAHELAQRGYVCLVPDYPSFGDYAYNFKKDGSHYASGSMKAIWNNIRAVDVLETVNRVDHDRIGCIGHSLGGHNSLFTAAFDQRLRAVVTSCGFTAFHHYYEGALGGWTSDRYMPIIRTEYENDPDRVPFDFYEVLAAIAPRGVFINAPKQDSNFAVEGVEKVVDVVDDVYRLRDATGKLVVEYPDSGHDFPDATRQAAYDWLDRELK